MAKNNPASHESPTDLLSGAVANPPVVIPAAASGLMLAIGDKIKALDAFADANNLALLTENRGQFESAIMVADAINHLKEMLTPDVMRPIMALQNTPLGFRTDKPEGYPVEVVRDAFIEITLKGFKIVGNEMNLIAGRGYITREGFEGAMRRLSQKGLFTDFQDSYSIPRIVSDSEAVVTASASWKWKGITGKIENAQFSIRMNKGMGADGAIGKAKRKLKARVYERITGTAVTEGDATETHVIDVSARNVAESGAAGAAPGVAGAPGPAMPSDEQKQLVKEVVGTHVEKANTWLLANNAILAGQTFVDVTAKTAAKIIAKPKEFLSAIGAE